MYLTRLMSVCETVSCAVAQSAKRRESIEKTDFCIMFILLIFVLGFIFIKCLGKRIQYLSNGKISRTDHFIGSAIVNLQSVTADMVPVGEYDVSKEARLFVPGKRLHDRFFRPGKDSCRIRSEEHTLELQSLM